MPRETQKADRPAIASDLYYPIGTSGLRRVGQWIEEGSTRELVGPEGRKRLREMADTSLVLAAGLKLIGLSIRDAKFEPKAPGDGDTEWSPEVLEERALFAKSCLRDMAVTLDDVHAELLSANVYGWALCEEVLKLRQGEQAQAPLAPGTHSAPMPAATPSSKHTDGLVGWHGFFLRAQETCERWEFDANGEPVGMWQSDMWAVPGRGTVLIPIERALHYRTESAKNNPEGRSLLAPCWKTWVIVKRVQEWEALGIQRELNGVPVVRVPEEVAFVNGADPTATQKHELVKRMVFGLNSDAGAGIILPSTLAENAGSSSDTPMWDVELLSNTGTRAIDAGAVITRLEHRMATALLSAFLLLGQDKVGSYALAENNADMFLLALNAVASSIADTWTRQAFPRLMRYNGWPMSQAPIMTVQPIKKLPAPKDVAALLAILSQTGTTLPPLDEAGAEQLLAQLNLRPAAEQL